MKVFSSKSTGNDFQEKRCTILILDRSFDMTAPILHDFTYECLLYDIVSTPQQAEKLCSEESKIERQGQSEMVLDRTDIGRL